MYFIYFSILSDALIPCYYEDVLNRFFKAKNQKTKVKEQNKEIGFQKV